MPMTSFWCFSIKRFGTRFAGAALFFSMKPFYSTNRVLSVHRSTCISTRRFSGSPPHALPIRLRLCRAMFNADTYGGFLEDIARRFRRKGAVLVRDNASYHKDKDIHGSKRIDIGWKFTS